MIVQTIRERLYEVVSTKANVIFAPDGTVICMADADTRITFVAPASFVEMSDDDAKVTPTFNPARRLFRLQSAGTHLPASRSKYSRCASVAEMRQVQTDYVADIADGIWYYTLEALETGDSAFESVVGLREFRVSLPALRSGYRMFSGCILSLESVRCIAHSLPPVINGTLTLGIDVRLMRSAPLQELLKQMESKGWLLEVQYNTPAGVPILAELEYLQSSGKQFLLIDEPFKKGTGFSADACFADSRLAQNSYYLYFYHLVFNSSYRLYAGLNGTAHYLHNDEYGNYGSLLKAYSSDGRCMFSYNFLSSGEKVLKTSAGTYNQAITAAYVKQSSKFPILGLWNEMTGANSAIACEMRIYSLQMSQGGEITRDLIPVLDETGEACLFDKVSQSYFRNAGSGAFSWALKPAPMMRRGRSAPLQLPRSPVWARVAADGSTEWCHYTGNPEGWSRFSSPEEAMELLGKTKETE